MLLPETLAIELGTLSSSLSLTPQQHSYIIGTWLSNCTSFTFNMHWTISHPNTISPTSWTQDIYHGLAHSRPSNP
eukprot:scaffold336_cov196-Amphora_coffeaeformis.AAC.6